MQKFPEEKLEKLIKEEKWEEVKKELDEWLASETDADRQREVIVAEAYRDAQRIKGEGDAKAAETYAAAYGKNPEFYAFYRSLDAYRNSFKSKSDVMVLQPDSDFFKYMRDAGGRKK